MTDDQFPHRPKVKSRKGQWFFAIGLLAAVAFGLHKFGGVGVSSSGLSTASADKVNFAVIDVVMGGAWIRQPPPGIDMTAGYLKITNPGKSHLRLVGVESDVFHMAEIHESKMIDGKMSMRPAGKVDIPSGETLQLAPGGVHLMLMHPHKELKAGESISLNLVFENGRGERDVLSAPFRVKGL